MTCRCSATYLLPLGGCEHAASQGDQTSVTLTPGMRTHLGNDWYFLAGLPVPVTKDRTADIGMIFWFMKAW